MALSRKARKKIGELAGSRDCPIHLLPMYFWYLQRRDAQVCPKPMPTIWFLLGGRGAGKTYTASNHIYDYCINLPHTPENRIVYVALIGATFDDVKQTMVEGKSGLLNIIQPENLIAWNRTVGELKFFIRDGGNYREVRCATYTSERPDKLRGPNTHVAWIDEYAKFKDSDTDPLLAGTTWNNMMLGLRLGTNPHVIVTGTPTPCKLTRYLLDHPSMAKSHMPTDDNRENLPASFLVEIDRINPNSRTYRQEIMAEVLFDNPDAIFRQEAIDENRAGVPDEEDKVYKVLGYDPSASSSPDSDECGIIVCAWTPEIKERSGTLGGRPVVVKPTHAYILKDLSGHYTPNEQTQLVIQTVLKDGIDDLVFEQNQGVEFVMSSLEQALKDNVLEYKIRKENKSKKTDYGIVKRFRVSGVDADGNPFKFTVYAIHATSGKKLRAEMVSTRYDSDQVHHPVEDQPLPTCELGSCGANLEYQMTAWDPKSSRNSPDRLDAMVYCLLHIFSGFMLTKSKVTIARPAEVTQAASQHGAVAAKRRRGRIGAYSADFAKTEPGKAIDRGLIEFMEGGPPHDIDPYLGRFR